MAVMVQEISRGGQGRRDRYKSKVALRMNCRGSTMR
jgi:hypothetical protein